jgi:hypothetical protein
MDNNDIEKYKREVEQNQMREQGLFKIEKDLFQYLLNSALKKNNLLDEIRKGILKEKKIYSIDYLSLSSVLFDREQKTAAKIG